MLRKDREMDREFALEVIDKSSFGTLSLIDKNGNPYSVPLSIARKGAYLYFHSAKQGTKIECLNYTKDVYLTFVSYSKVPDIVKNEEIVQSSQKDLARLLGSKIFTTEFESAAVKGKISLIEDKKEKIKALKYICEKYVPSSMDLFYIAAEASVDLTSVYKIEIEDITGKRKMFDKNGEEMKWGRKE